LFWRSAEEDCAGLTRKDETTNVEDSTRRDVDGAHSGEDKPAEKKAVALTADQLARIENINLKLKPMEDALNLLYQKLMEPVVAERTQVYREVCKAAKLPDDDCVVDLEKRELRRRPPVAAKPELPKSPVK